MTKRVLQRTALVTGAAKRIGRAIAIALANAGYDIGVHYGQSRDDALALVRELETLGVKAYAIQGDLSDVASVAGLIDRAREALGPIDVLVNNASVFADDRARSLTLDSWQMHMDTNLLAPVLLSQAFAAQSDIREGASIINMIDQRVLKPSPPFFSYSMSKAGLWHATRTLAQALAPHIRVNAVGPGPTLKSIHQSEADFAREARSTLLQKPTSPEEVAAAVIYLLSAPSVTGQMICVDSGQHLNWRTLDMFDL
ncbi:SDR family oxidoreductase [Asticcacaulis taihuensis]|uniref:NAD(P)-dependent dehydrogenase, short-chain alcohol dehydrogenase family n=1 Tax=Asticcacaulis taihuensis TaxID=260084 RepID=A0A1G4QTX8_9CAUL|nr:SDR family oxidoreductase [Asticcacaulis taihuensis]SCW48066.1 NAD(P)-dependent dehydrogenase, short-chain alcohol dehydrogenase family [Asticcacaulis taihuensis]